MIEPYFDPYDLWLSPRAVAIKERFYAGDTLAKGQAALILLADWLIPGVARSIGGSQPAVHPITAAHAVLKASFEGGASSLYGPIGLELLRTLASDGLTAWGLGFPWMSKNGLYEPSVPFITHTPYVMEALLALAAIPNLQTESMKLFHGTWAFLESLLVMAESDGRLALSYAPLPEPRIVINANAYAAFAYALHARHGLPKVQETAKHKALALSRWVMDRQAEDGRWHYYADEQPGNFIDGFHSCFVLKNLHKVTALLPDADFLLDPIARGRAFVQTHLFDEHRGLCRRFMYRDLKDPFQWDLYDQAEFLGLLIDSAKLKEADRFRRHVAAAFSDQKEWWCRLDRFNRPWGRNFLRWGIMPFWYHSARLDHALSATGGK